MKKITLYNVLSNLILQILTIINFLIIPKLILTYFGSEVNGLISSINQFLSYISLIEGGITGVIIANLYKPIIEKDENKINSIYITAKKFYLKVAYIFILYSLILGILYPLIFETSFSFIYVFSLIIILSINLLIQYMFSITNKSLLQADKKIYIVSNIQSIIIIANIVLSIISLKVYPNIHILKLLSGLLYFLQPVIYNYYVKKHYSINKIAKPDNSLLKQRWDGFAINIAAFVHISTDITLLTIFTDLKTVSIYSVYALITNGIKQIITSITSSITPTIGQSYAKKNIDDLNEKMDIYEYIVFIAVFLLYSVTLILITPFVLLYTSNILDTNYNQPLFGILLVISEAIYLIKTHHLNLAYSANKFKEITRPAFIEASINIIISLLLVRKKGLIGIMIGTIIAMLYRMVFHINFTKKHIINRNQSIFYKKLIIFTFTSTVLITICKKILPIVEIDFISWLIHAVCYMFIFSLGYYIISILFFKKELNYLKKYIFKKGDGNFGK